MNYSHLYRRLGNALFWRTFLLLTFLIVASVIAWLASFSMFERTPRTEQLAAQITSTVTITRAALEHTAPEMRRELLFDLASREGIRIYPLQTTDKIDPLDVSSSYPRLINIVRDSLAKDTLFASSVNEVKGLWISFRINKDEYWLMLDRTRLNDTSSSQWLRWVPMALIISLIGAALISALINQPLARLTSAARAVAAGKKPPTLPESGPTEIAEANKSFNQMVKDLTQIEADRSLVLAGISHDLRTPIARLLLEIEMAGLNEDARTGMQADLTQMNAIISQFTNYAKPFSELESSECNISDILTEIARHANHRPNMQVTTEIQPHIIIESNQIEIKRVINNLIENAYRYGKTPETNTVSLHISCKTEGNKFIAEFSDRGTGIPESEFESVLKPFTRLNTARSQANGSGLGLAIVNRIIIRHNGQLSFSNRPSGGLTVKMTLPLKQP